MPIEEAYCKGSLGWNTRLDRSENYTVEAGILVRHSYSTARVAGNICPELLSISKIVSIPEVLSIHKVFSVYSTPEVLSSHLYLSPDSAILDKTTGTKDNVFYSIAVET